MIIRLFVTGLAWAATLPAALADEMPGEPDAGEAVYYSGLEDLSLRRDITGISHYYIVRPESSAPAGEEFAADSLYQDATGGSAGGYVTFGSPTTSTFLGTVSGHQESSWHDGVEFGVNWRPEISGGQDTDVRRIGRSLSGSEVDRVGVRADLTALLRDKAEAEAGVTAWRVSGMLGSTSLSLYSEDDRMSPDAERGGLLWDIGVGWSSGAMSLNAGYQSGHSLDDEGADSPSIAVLSLGADYAVLPGLSVYGEFSLIDGPPAENVAGLGTVVIVGTGVSF